MSGFSVHTGSLGSASDAIGADAVNMQSELAWLNAGESFEDPSVNRAIADLLLTWRITADRVVGDLQTLAGNVKAAQDAYSNADREIEKATVELAPATPKESKLA